MKRIGNLYGEVASFESLFEAAYRARRGKRSRRDVAAFHYDLENNLLDLRRELNNRTYQPGKYRAFQIRDPKKRLISAAPYRDRVVHHALCNVLEPIFERGFIHHSYANREGKGTHSALDQATVYARRFRYVLKCDIEKYFPSIDHQILMERISRKVKCPGTLWLVEKILANSNPQEEVVRYYPGDDLFTPSRRRRGIPIGNLTSQFFANVYLDGFDHFVEGGNSGAVTPRMCGYCDLKGRSSQEWLPYTDSGRVECGDATPIIRRGYVRFADDFLLFCDSKEDLQSALTAMQVYLDGLRLQLHPAKCHVVPTARGFAFLGWQVYPDHRKLRRKTGVRIQRALRELVAERSAGRIGVERLRSSVMSWIGHLKHGDTWGLRRKLFAAARFSGGRPVQGDGKSGGKP